MGQPINLVGKRFGRLTVTTLFGLDRFKRRMWKCQCDCGAISIVQAGNLRSGNTVSCGCYEVEARYIPKGNAVKKYLIGHSFVCKCGSQTLVTATMSRNRIYRCRQCSSEATKRSALRHPDRVSMRERRYAKDHPLIKKAHSAVRTSLANGSLEKLPCTVCGTTSKVQAHHDDYSKPLSVLWLCQPHHADRHAEMNRTSRVS